MRAFPRTTVGRASALLWLLMCMAPLVFAYFQRDDGDESGKVMWSLVALTFPIGLPIGFIAAALMAVAVSQFGLPYSPFFDRLPIWLVMVVFAYWQWLVVVPSIGRRLMQRRGRGEQSGMLAPNSPLHLMVEKLQSWIQVRRRWFVALLGAATVAVLVVVPLPYPTTETDKAEALGIALDALLRGTPVPTLDGEALLKEQSYALVPPDHLYFINETGVSDSAFLRHGLRPVPAGKSIDVDHGDVVVRASFRDARGEKTWHMQFSYVFGSVGGHGYEIRIYKSLLGRKITFVRQWVA